jgi:hypothetical protein
MPAFLRVAQSSVSFQAEFNQGIVGLMGLGFDTTGSSRINDAVKQAEGINVTRGQSVLSNIFAQSPSGSNYFAISLSRTGDQEGTADGSLTIAEYDSHYAAVANAPKLAQTPANTGRWTVVMDALSVRGKIIPFPSNLTAAPAGKSITLLDSEYVLNFVTLHGGFT